MYEEVLLEYLDGKHREQVANELDLYMEDEVRRIRIEFAVS